MRVVVPIAFEVEGLEDHEMSTAEAHGAAELAAYDYLAFVLETTQGRAQEDVEVHGEGYGKCRVALKGPDDG